MSRVPRKWCATEDNKVDQLNSSLERFNTLVQEKLSSDVLEQFRGGPMQFSHVMEVACVSWMNEIPGKWTIQYGGFHKWWYPQIIHLSRIFHSKPSVLEVPPF